MMSVYSHSGAERRNSPYEDRNHARRKSYVARLIEGPRDTIARQFVERQKDGNQIRFDVERVPGDIYEIRRWLWDSHRQNYFGGMVYIGFDDEVKPFVLTRDEAYQSVLMRRVSGRRKDGSVDIIVQIPTRIIPADLHFYDHKTA